MNVRRVTTHLAAAGIVCTALLVIAALAIIIPTQAQTEPVALAAVTLEAAKTVPHGNVCATHNLWWYIVVTNTSTVTAANVVVTDTLPDGIYDVRVSDGGSFDGEHEVVWALGDLEPSASITVWIQAKPHSISGGKCLTNGAWIDADDLEVPVYVTATVCVYPLPNVDAIADLERGCEPLTVQFSGRVGSGTPPFAYRWSFGDGSTSNERNPSHTYGSPGTYTARLYVEDAHGCADEDSVDITVYENPSAAATAAPTEGCEPLTVSFSGSATRGTPPYSYRWDFGDGLGTSSQRDPSYTYDQPGTYSAVLTVHDAHGCQDMAQVDITVYENPVAVAAVDPASGLAPLEAQFSGTASGGTPPYSYLWDFGNGLGTSDQQNPSFTYYIPGEYAAILTVTDANGCQGSASVSVTVERHDYYWYLPKIKVNTMPTCYCEAAPSWAAEFEDPEDWTNGWAWDSFVAGTHTRAVVYDPILAAGALSMTAAAPTTSFPFLERSDLFAGLDSGFCLEIRFRYPRSDVYGVTIGLNSTPDVQRQPDPAGKLQPGVEDILSIHQVNTAGFCELPDYCFFRVRLLSQDPSQEANRWQQEVNLCDPANPSNPCPDDGAHVVHIKAMKAGSEYRYQLYIDDLDNPVPFPGGDTWWSDSRKPASVYIGNPRNRDRPSQWSQLLVDYIRVFPLTCVDP